MIEDGEKIAKIFAALGDSPSSSVTLHVNFGILEEESDRLAFLRGAFLAGGSVTDPAKRYHLELITSHYKVCRETYALLLDVGFSPKELTRGGSGVLYFKQSNYIEDFLTAIGAPETVSTAASTVRRRISQRSLTHPLSSLPPSAGWRSTAS